MMVFNSQSACWGKGNMIYFQVALKEAMESCMQENHSGLLKPANPILALLNQNANTLPFPVNNNNPFQSLPAPAPSKNHSGLLKPANPILALLNQNANTLPF